MDREEDMSEETPSAQQWLEGLAKELNLPDPSTEEINNLLDLAGIAAHSSERDSRPNCLLANWSSQDKPGRSPEACRKIREQTR